MPIGCFKVDSLPRSDSMENVLLGRYLVSSLSVSSYIACLRRSSTLSLPRQHHRFVSDVTRKDWQWLLNSMVYGSLFSDMDDESLASLKLMGLRWKEYEKQGLWSYEEHSYWVSGWTFWDIKNEAPDLFINLADSDLLIFKGMPMSFLLSTSISHSTCSHDDASTSRIGTKLISNQSTFSSSALQVI